jgi:hypothetical protein
MEGPTVGVVTMTVEKTWGCDYRECEESRRDIKVGRRGETPWLYGDLPQSAGWVKIAITTGGRNESLHFCCQDHAEKEMNLLTQQGLSSPEPQKMLER